MNTTNFSSLFVIVAAVLAGFAGDAKADVVPSSFTAIFSSDDPNTTAVASFDLDLNLVSGPVVGSGSFAAAGITDFTLTVSDLKGESTVFTEEDFTGVSFSTNGATLDFSTELVGQPTLEATFANLDDLNRAGDFNFFGSGGLEPAAPFTFIVNSQRFELTSFAPTAEAVPEPSSLALLGFAFGGLALRRRK